jgi:acyl-CoA hydrolase
MGHEGVKISGREPVLRVMPMPADMNGNGDIFGG